MTLVNKALPNLASCKHKTSAIQQPSPNFTNLAKMLIPHSSMALPVITAVSDCADFSKTVEPYLPQVYMFANNMAASITNADGLKQL